MRILLIEDETIFALMLAEELKDEFHEVELCSNRDDALKIATKLKPNLVISDWQLDGITGGEICDQIRGLFPEVAVIFISGSSIEMIRKNTLPLHPHRIFTKPIDMAAMTASFLEIPNLEV